MASRPFVLASPGRCGWLFSKCRSTFCIQGRCLTLSCRYLSYTPVSQREHLDTEVTTYASDDAQEFRWGAVNTAMVLVDTAKEGYP